MAKNRVGSPPKNKANMPVVKIDEQEKPKRTLTKLERIARKEASQSIRVASYGSEFGNLGGGNIKGGDSSFYSPQLSTDFLELPQSEREKRELFRFWYTCFPPGAPILMADGTIRPIENILVGDYVINGFGEKTSVKELFRNEIDDNIVKMTVRGIQGSISSTGNHPFLVYRSEQVSCDYTDSSGICKNGVNALCRRVKCHLKDFGSPEFIYAKDLRVGDFIVSPKMRGVEAQGLNACLMRLLGYYASEGSPAYRSAGVHRGVEWSLNINEASTIAVEISDLCFAAFGKKARIYTDPNRNTTNVICDSLDLLKFCIDNSGVGSHEKRLSEHIMNASPELTLEFLGAYWNGDGCFTDNSYTADTMSASLASQVFQMARKVGFPAYHSKYDRPARTMKDGRVFPAGTVHYISFPGRYQSEFAKYANFVDGTYDAKSTRVYLTSVDSGFLHRIESLEAIPYCGTVYNFEVHGDGDRKSYVAHSLATHNTNPIVGSAIDFHTDVPMSKIRLSLPKGKDLKRNKQILHFYNEMCSRVKLFQTLYDATHEYWLHGGCFIFAEDHDLTEEIPEQIIADTEEEEVGEIDYAGRASRKKITKKKLKPESDRIKNIREFVAENYKGWQRLQILPPEQVKLEVFQYTNKTKMELIPSEKDRLLVMRADDQKDEESARIAEDIPEQIRENLRSGQPIPLHTSPYDDFLCSSFCYYLAHKKAAYDDRGISLLERCHLPGTEVTARRYGEIIQIPIEELNPNTDEVLGGSGLWRKFQTGSRPYVGNIVSIEVSKIETPVKCTPDHKMWVLRDDVEVQVEAREIVEGDLIRAASIKPETTIDEIDLHKFFSSEKWTYENRETGEEYPMRITPSVRGDKLILTHSWVDENPQRDTRATILERVTDWIGSLKESATMMYEQFQEMFDGIGQSVYRAIIRDLATVGYDAPLVVVEDSKYKSKGRLFRPAKIDVSKLYEKHATQECPKTLKLTRELGFAIGYFLGDGWVAQRKSPTLYGPGGICYSAKSENSVKSVGDVFKTLNDSGIFWKNTEKKAKIASFEFRSDWWNRWIGRNFGHNKKDKHLPEWVFSAPEEFKFGLLSGLIDSDGWVSDYASSTIGMTTKKLIDQLQILSYGLGFGPSRGHRKPRMVLQANGKKVLSKDLYSLTWGCRKDLKRLRSGGSVKFKYLDLNDLGASAHRHKVHNGSIYLIVKSIKNNNYNGEVHSLNVEKDHTFFANFTLTANCLRTLLYSDKLRQAQTSIASRAMTPKRIVWADKMSETDTDSLRDQVDQALVDPDFTIVTNFEVHWDEIGSRDRLLDLSTEYDLNNKMLFIGLRITESMLTGESSYAGERVHLDVMNTMYLLYRERIAEYVEEYLFKPVAEKKGFWEDDEYGNRNLLYPQLQFTRLALRDNTELQDYMFNLYQKGSLPISFILDLLNIDSDDALEQLKRDMFTPNDSTFNEFLKNILSKAGDDAVEKTDAFDRIISSVGLKRVDKKGDRFGKEEE